MQIDEKTVRHIAKLARLYVADDELPALAGELSKIVAFVEQLNEVSVDDVVAMTSVTGGALYRRQDRVTEADLQSDILANAPEAREGFFTVPKVVE